jgi:hypothetical protein
MAPDFEYFFRFSVTSTLSHTGWGILYFNIPVVILLSLIFHLRVKANLIDSLPSFFRNRLHDLRLLDFFDYLKRNYIIFIISAGIGSLSHIFWDSFTHANGYFVRELPFYEDTIVPYDGARYPLYYALQHLSTFVGLSIITIYFIAQKPVAGLHRTTIAVTYWLVVSGITFTVVAARFLIYSDDYIIGNLVVTMISGFCIAVIIAGFINFRKTPA